MRVLLTRFYENFYSFMALIPLFATGVVPDQRLKRNYQSVTWKMLSCCTSPQMRAFEYHPNTYYASGVLTGIAERNVRVFILTF